MPDLSLYQESIDPSLAQLVRVCDQFIGQVQCSDPRVIYQAISLAEQVLATFNSLPELSDLLISEGWCLKGEKLPHQVLTVFAYAGASEHESLKTILDELEVLYGDGTEPKAVHDLGNLLSEISDYVKRKNPSLWSQDGALNYSPRAYSLIHEEALDREIWRLFYDGSASVEKALASYPLMNEASRKLIDSKLCDCVYRSLKSFDDPVREMLRDKLDEVADAKVRFEHLLDDMGDVDNFIGFEARFNHAFVLMEGLTPADKACVLGVIEDTVCEWTVDALNSGSQFDEPGGVVADIAQVFDRAGKHGFDWLESVARNFAPKSHLDSRVSRISALLGQDFEDLSRGLIKGEALRRAAIKVLPEEDILAAGMGAEQLSRAYQLRPSAAIRTSLQSSNAGRDIVFAQDLGL